MKRLIIVLFLLFGQLCGCYCKDTFVEDHYYLRQNYSGCKFSCELTNENRACIDSIIHENYNEIGIYKEYLPQDPAASVTITASCPTGDAIIEKGYTYEIDIQYNLILGEGILVIKTNALLVNQEEQVISVMRALQRYIDYEIFDGMRAKRYVISSVSNRVGKTTVRFKL